MTFNPMPSFNAHMNTTEEILAGRLYNAYCAAVGGKAFNGDDLPTWTEFRSAQSKVKQSDAWIVVAKEAILWAEVHLPEVREF